MPKREASSGFLRSGMPFNRLGHGPRPLVIFQGLVFENKPQPGLTNSWYTFLGNDYTVYAVLRKPGMPRGYTLKDMANDYAAMIREEFGGPIDVIGMSTGGSIVQHFAADHPALVRRLVIHSSAHTLSESARRLQLQIGELGRQGQWIKANHALFSAVFARPGVKGYLYKPLVWLMARLMAMDSPKDPTDLVVTVEAEDKHAFKERLGEITAPTLVIAGTRDPFYTVDLFRETAAGIPKATLILYEGMGHPASGKRFVRDVLAFLRAEDR